MKTLLLIILAISLAGCAGSSKPNFRNGYYYWAGGEGCSNWRPLSNNRMMCQDDDHNDTWAISPMTDQQLEMYQHNQQMSQQQFQNKKGTTCYWANGTEYCY